MPTHLPPGAPNTQGSAWYQKCICCCTGSVLSASHFEWTSFLPFLEISVAPVYAESRHSDVAKWNHRDEPISAYLQARTNTLMRCTLFSFFGSFFFLLFFCCFSFFLQLPPLADHAMHRYFTTNKDRTRGDQWETTLHTALGAIDPHRFHLQ